MSTDTIQHGTYAGVQHCAKRAEGACDDCKAARNSYMREYRARHPGYREIEQARSKATSRALWRLAGIYADEFQTLYADEFGRA